MKAILTIFILILSLSGYAQKYKQATITMSNNEQKEYLVECSFLSGLLITHLQSEGLFIRRDYNYILAKVDAEAEVREMSLKSVKSIEIDGKYYSKLQVQHPDRDENTAYMVLRIQEGPMELYKHQLNTREGFPKTIYYLYKDKILYEVRRNRFKMEIEAYMPENKELVDLIRAGKLKYSDLEEIVKQYNAWAKAVPEKEVYYQEAY